MMEYSKDKAFLRKELDETWALNPTHILIWHKEFINKFILDNYFYFDVESGNEESTKDIAELINKTAFYVNRKINNKILEATFAINGNKPNRHITQLQSRNKDRLAKIKDDLLSLSVYGGKTQTMLNLINECLENMEIVIPNKQHYSQNVEEIRNCLSKRGLSKETVDSYISYFRDL